MGNTDRITLSIVIANYERELLSSGPLVHGGYAERCESYAEILDYLAMKGSSRKNYRHYGTRGRVSSILEGSAFYLTDGSGWNDEYDKGHFNPPFSDYKKFGICLSAATSESIAMWMLYGGMDGNGAMINFDKKTLRSAMSGDEYECGFFDEGKRFRPVLSLDASEIGFDLVDVLYFSRDANGETVVVERVGEDRKARMSADTFGGIAQIAKHKAWSYEAEVRLVAKVSKLALGNKASSITAIRAPFDFDEAFASDRVFDSPVSDSRGRYRDSELRGTVEWDLCKGCMRK